MRLRNVSLLCAAVLLAACSSAGDTGKNPQDFSNNDAQVLFDPLAITGQAVIPFPFDGLFAGFSSPTLNIPLVDPTDPTAAANALPVAANMVDGFSTTASLFIDVTGQLDYNSDPTDAGSVANHLLIINTKTHALLTVANGDFVVQNSLATAHDLATNTDTPIATQRSRILILLEHPLQPATTYLAAFTKGVKTVQGAGVTASDEFLIASSATPLDQQTNPALKQFTPPQIATLENLRSQLIYPAVQALGSAPISIPPSQLLLAWTFTTESIGDTLKLIAANPPTSDIGVQVADTRQNTASPGFPGLGDAEVYAGITKIPYYLNVPATPVPVGSPATSNSQLPLSGFWHADPNKPTQVPNPVDPKNPSIGKFLGKVPCTAFAAGVTLPDGKTAQPSASTTACFSALDQSPDNMHIETIPVLMTVPNASSGQTEPANGWPVVIFQHGITRNRLDMLAVADGLAKAGFVVVAIDLPLHGITDTDDMPTDANYSPFYDNQLFAQAAPSLMTTERTFNLDLQNNSTSAPGPDGKIDGSGSHFINLPSLITSRDNIRQAVSDLLTLANTLKTAGGIAVAGAGPLKIDPTKIRFFGHSLGAIVGSTLLGVDNGGLFGAAVLANPGGGIAKLLDASGTIGPNIAGGLAASGVQQGSDDYETFIRFAQQLIDPADPINYAKLARANHKIDMIEVIGDAVVPNSADTTCPAKLSLAGINSPQQLADDCPSVPLIESGIQPTDPTTGKPIFQQDVTIEPGYLAGTAPLWAEMVLTPIGPITPPVAPSANTSGHYVVQFKADGARHGSVLDPSTNPFVTGEMQCEAASFLATGGALLPVGCLLAP